MNTSRDSYQAPPMKASDADRDEVLAALSEHFQVGRLTTDELEERTGRALAARTLIELSELTADLPATRPGSAAPAPAGAVQPPRLPRNWPLALLPAAAVLAVVIILGVALAHGTGHHEWAGWWVIPVGLLVARRIAGRRGMPPGSRRGLPPGYDRRDLP
jgi:hypothetical protein